MRRQREAATALYVRQTTGTSDYLIKLIEAYGFFPSLWEGLGEGAKLDAHKPSPQPSPKGRGRKTSNFSLSLSFAKVFFNRQRQTKVCRTFRDQFRSSVVSR